MARPVSAPLSRIIVSTREGLQTAVGVTSRPWFNGGLLKGSKMIKCEHPILGFLFGKF